MSLPLFDHFCEAGSEEDHEIGSGEENPLLPNKHARLGATRRSLSLTIVLLTINMAA